MAEQQPEAQSSNMAQAEPTSYGKPPLRVSYKVPFSLRLRYTITSIAHFFRIMQPQQNYAESPEFLPIKNGQRVGSYRDSLSLLYLDPKTVNLARNHWRVAEIRTFKDKGTKVKHEYLVATLRDGGAGRGSSPDRAPDPRLLSQGHSIMRTRAPNLFRALATRRNARRRAAQRRERKGSLPEERRGRSRPSHVQVIRCQQARACSAHRVSGTRSIVFRFRSSSCWPAPSTIIQRNTR
jgi:hypothetical protein